MTIAKTIGTTPILDVPPDEIGSGQKTVTAAGTAEQISATDTPCRRIYITGISSNTGKVYVGGSSVSSSSGMYLYAGQTVTIDIDNLNKVYIDVDNNSEGINYTYVV